MFNVSRLTQDLQVVEAPVNNVISPLVVQNMKPANREVCMTEFKLTLVAAAALKLRNSRDRHLLHRCILSSAKVWFFPYTRWLLHDIPG
jgi:hypothetical protein